MNDLPSSDFRRTYQALTEPVTVSAYGRMIGTWVPGTSFAAEAGYLDALHENERLVAEVVHLKRELAARPLSVISVPPYPTDFTVTNESGRYTVLQTPGLAREDGIPEDVAAMIDRRRAQQAEIDATLARVNRKTKP